MSSLRASAHVNTGTASRQLEVVAAHTVGAFVSLVLRGSARRGFRLSCIHAVVPWLRICRASPSLAASPVLPANIWAGACMRILCRCCGTKSGEALAGAGPGRPGRPEPAQTGRPGRLGRAELAGHTQPGLTFVIEFLEAAVRWQRSRSRRVETSWGHQSARCDRLESGTSTVTVKRRRRVG